MINNSNFKNLSPTEMDAIYGGGVGDWISEKWNAAVDYVQGCFNDLSRGMYDSTGCGGKH